MDLWILGLSPSPFNMSCSSGLSWAPLKFLVWPRGEAFMTRVICETGRFRELVENVMQEKKEEALVKLVQNDVRRMA